MALLAIFCSIASGVNAATIVVYTDYAAWSAVSSGVTTIDFESPDASGGNVLLTGNEYATLSGAPILNFSATPGINPDQNLQVGEADLEVGPNSGDQLLFPGLFVQGAAGNGGVLQLSLNSPQSAFGAFFADIEKGKTTTGFDIDRDGNIDVLFSDAYPINPDDGETVFLGFVTDMPVASIDIHLNSANLAPPGSDGVGLDDLSYGSAVVPLPGAALLLGSALTLLAWPGRKRQGT